MALVPNNYKENDKDKKIHKRKFFLKKEHENISTVLMWVSHINDIRSF